MPLVPSSLPALSRLPLALGLGASLALLSACGEDTGGAAGDADPGTDPFAPSPIEPFVGVYELNGPLNGVPEDEALLVIRPVDEEGESRVLVYELDSRDNCYLRPASGGKAVPDPAFRRDVFLERVASFDQGVLSLSGNALVITYFDTFDVDGNGDTREQLSFRAPSVGISETDIETQRCS